MHALPYSAPDPAAGHRQPRPPQETPGNSQVSLGQSLVGSGLLSPESCAHKVLSVPSRSLFWRLYGGVNGDLLQQGSCHTQACRTQSPRPQQATADRHLHRRHSKAGLAQFSWGLLVHTGFVWALQASLVGTGFDSKRDFAPPTISLWLPLCSWTWGIFFWCDPTFCCRWLFGSEL